MAADILYPIGIQTFADIRKGKMLYVDKTAFVYKMTRTKSPIFLSRPRRFGKSLLVTTLEAYFQGRKDLFEGLAIDRLEHEWTSYPVFHFDLSMGKYYSMDNLMTTLHKLVSGYEQEYGIVPNSSLNYGTRLATLIETAYSQTGQEVVVLVDEYDAPMLDSINDHALQEQVRNVCRDFFSPLKALQAKLRFVFLTGISKFSQLSIFSELNNLTNISMMDEYSDICGISKEEMSENLMPGIELLAEKKQVSAQQMLTMLQHRYDGYHFSAHGRDMYNPFSLLSALSEKELKSYWFSTGTPTHLIELLDKESIEMLDLEHLTSTADRFDQPTERIVDPIPVLYQSGYLTIKGYDEEFDEYILSFPNTEVRQGFANSIINYLSEKNQYVGGKDYVRRAYVAFRKEGGVDKLIEAVKVFLGRVPYQINRNEAHYHTLFYALMVAVGADVMAEVSTAKGRLDMVLRTPSDAYVFEFKFNESAQAAISQIQEKDYLSAARGENLNLWLVGVNYSQAEHNINDYVIDRSDH